MTQEDTEAAVIKQLAELERQLYVLENTPSSVFPMWDTPVAGEKLERAHELKMQIEELEETLRLHRHGTA